MMRLHMTKIKKLMLSFSLDTKMMKKLDYCVSTQVLTKDWAC